MDIEAKIKELENNKEFMDKLVLMDNLADVAKAFNEEGIEVTEEDIEKAREMYGTNGNELDEDELAIVSGGGGCFWTTYLTRLITRGFICHSLNGRCR